MRRFVPVIVLAVVCGAGCAMNQRPVGLVDASRAPLTEPDWIHNGESLEIDGLLWHPTDEVENLLDAEVAFTGEYHGVAVYADRTDVKPYSRLYTRFARNRYRAFEQARTVPVYRHRRQRDSARE